MRARGFALLLVGLAALVVVLLCFERGSERPAVPREGGDEARQGVSAPADLGSPTVDAALEPPHTRGAVEASARREDAAARVPSGPIRGRLVEESGGAPLAVVRLLLFASPGEKVAESLLTDADGTFMTARAFPRGAVRVWVRDPVSKALIVRHEAPFDPEARGPWSVPVPPGLPVARPADRDAGTAALRGRVVAHGGRGVEGVLVRAMPLGGGPLARSKASDERGEFHLTQLSPGSCRVIALAAFGASAMVELVLEEGENDLGELFLPVEESPGPIRGRLVAEPGGEEPFGILILREVQGGRELALFSGFSTSEDDTQALFEIPGVPPGSYELSVVAIDGRRYAPAAQLLSPPCEGVEFRAEATRGLFYVLDVRDRASGAKLEAIALGRTRGQWWGYAAGDPAFTRAVDRWLVYAPEHRAARGDFSRAVPTGTDDDGFALARVEVELERGYALALLFKDAAGTRLVAPELGDFLGDGLAGVQVFDGTTLVAESDADGLALVDLPRAPERLHYGLPGWRPAGERDEGVIRFVQMIPE